MLASLLTYDSVYIVKVSISKDASFSVGLRGMSKASRIRQVRVTTSEVHFCKVPSPDLLLRLIFVAFLSVNAITSRQNPFLLPFSFAVPFVTAGK